ncbi:hypothetical protein C6361_00555 [Plantactinospora sp. BC1]|nr:hypothetical protein C6361_00555 [Plantactinospora sp. BC1]
MRRRLQLRYVPRRHHPVGAEEREQPRPAQDPQRGPAFGDGADGHRDTPTSQPVHDFGHTAARHDLVDGTDQRREVPALRREHLGRRDPGAGQRRDLRRQPGVGAADEVREPVQRLVPAEHDADLPGGPQ